MTSQTEVNEFVAEIDKILRTHGATPVGDDLIRQTVTHYGRDTAAVGLAHLKAHVAAVEFLTNL